MAKTHYPPVVNWEITNECNHNCIHCYNYWRSNTENNREEPTEELLMLISDRIVESKPVYVVITGGEPLLKWNVVKTLISKFRGNSIFSSVNTNGRLMTDEVALFLRNMSCSAFLSFPCVDEHISDYITSSKGSVEAASNAIMLLKKHGVPCATNMVVTKLNLPFVYDTLKHISELGVPAKISVAGRPINATSEFDKYAMSTRDWEYMIQQCVDVYNDYGFKVAFSARVPDCAFANEDAYSLFGGSGCSAGVYSYAVTTSGDVKACVREQSAYGSILNEGIDVIYDKMKCWRDGELTPKECTGCNRIKSCRGACRLDMFSQTGRLHSMQSIADTSRVPINYIRKSENANFDTDTHFILSNGVLSLEEKECVRISRGQSFLYLSPSFYRYITENKSFSCRSIAESNGESLERVEKVVKLLQSKGLIEHENNQ